MSFVKEFILYLKARRKFWLLPIIIILLLFGSIIIFGEGSAVAPLIYTIF